MEVAGAHVAHIRSKVTSFIKSLLIIHRSTIWSPSLWELRLLAFASRVSHSSSRGSGHAYVASWNLSVLGHLIAPSKLLASMAILIALAHDKLGVVDKVVAITAIVIAMVGTHVVCRVSIVVIVASIAVVLIIAAYRLHRHALMHVEIATEVHLRGSQWASICTHVLNWLVSVSLLAITVHHLLLSLVRRIRLVLIATVLIVWFRWLAAGVILCLDCLLRFLIGLVSCNSLPSSFVRVTVHAFKVVVGGTVLRASIIAAIVLNKVSTTIVVAYRSRISEEILWVFISSLWRPRVIIVRLRTSRCCSRCRVL